MFPSDSITWVQTVEIPDGTEDKIYIYSGEKDTLSGHEYYVLRRDYSNEIEFYVREDLEKGKVWSIHFTNVCEIDTAEQLIMDLNFNIGDSIIYHYCNSRDSIYIKVAQIGTIDDLKVIEFDHPNKYLLGNTPLKFIEGIGPNYGFREHEFYDQILCKLFYNDSLVYALDTVGLTCPFFTDVDEYTKPDRLVNVYPNPFETVLNISLENLPNLSAHISFYDIAGRLLLHQDLNETFTQINLSSYANQMIFYKVTADEFSFTGKVFKK